MIKKQRVIPSSLSLHYLNEAKPFLKPKKVNYPVTIWKNLENKHEYKFTFTAPGCELVGFENPIVLPGSYEWGMQSIITRDMHSKEHRIFTERLANIAEKFVTESKFWDRYKFDNSFLVKYDMDEGISFKTPLFILFNIQQYWHWFMEQLPIIYFMSQHKNIPIIMNGMTDWQRESIKMMGIQNEIIELKKQVPITAPFVYAFTMPSTSYRGKVHPSAIRNVRKKLGDSTNVRSDMILDNSKYAERIIYISREDSKARKLKNEKELLDFLIKKGHNIEIYEMSKLKLEEKIMIFNQAKAVIGPTGAGFTHCMLMQPKTTVIDINHQYEVYEECGWNCIGNAVDLNWHTVIADKSVQNQENRNQKPKNYDLELSEKQFGIFDEILRK